MACCAREACRLISWLRRSARLSIATSPATLERHYQRLLRRAAGKARWSPFSVKANGNLAVLKTLGQLGAGRDVVSGGELAQGAGRRVFPPPRLFSLASARQAEEMRTGLEAGIYQFNVESEPELAVLNEVAQAAGASARPSRCASIPDVDAKTHAKITTGTAETKFGIPFAHGARSLRPCRHARTGYRDRRHRCAYRQPDHRPGTVRGRLHAGWANWSQALRADGHIITRLIWAAGWACPTREQQHAAARSRRLRQGGDAGDQGFWLPPVLRTGPADRRQCRACWCSRVIYVEARRRQDLPDHRCGHERSDPPRHA